MTYKGLTDETSFIQDNRQLDTTEAQIDNQHRAGA
jgi:hypothetical protein